MESVVVILLGAVFGCAFIRDVRGVRSWFYQEGDAASFAALEERYGGMAKLVGGIFAGVGLYMIGVAVSWLV
ncbi:hypothetical protein ACVHNB_14430 [Streptomyces sp. YJ-C3]